MAMQRKTILLLALVSGLALVALPLVAAVSRDEARPVREGDVVTYHATIRRLDGVVVYTSDEEVGRREIAAGNALLPTDFSAKPYGPQVRAVEFTDAAWETTRFLVGRRVGDVVETPWMVKPFGSADDHSLPEVLGVYPKRMTLDLDEAFARGDRPRWDVEGLARDDFAEGRVVTFSTGLNATVERVREGRAELVLHATPGGAVGSKIFGFPIAVEEVDAEHVRLRPVLEPGDRFRTAGCSIPDGVIPPGEYTVTRREEGRIQLRENASGARALVLDETLRIEYRILAVESGTLLTALWSR